MPRLVSLRVGQEVRASLHMEETKTGRRIASNKTHHFQCYTFKMDNATQADCGTLISPGAAKLTSRSHPGIEPITLDTRFELLVI
jgi:hypothetical protein